MPLWKFRSLEEAEAHLDRLPRTPESSLRSALALLALSEGARRGIRTSQRGIVAYRTIEEAEADRARFALEQLRALPPETAAAIDRRLQNAYAGEADEMLDEIGELIDPDSSPAVLRSATADDLPFLFRLYASTRQEELAPVGWPPDVQEAFLLQQFEAQHRWYHEQYAGASFDVIEVDGELVGRFYVARWERSIRVVDISLMPTHRGRGIGGALLSRLFEEADRDGKPVSIHVERVNPAQRLYERLGFRLAEDKGVYLLLERPVGGAQSSGGDPSLRSG
jgi:GNAT superfamily N-acetyltransferase